jgi:hypothetical protein
LLPGDSGTQQGDGGGGEPNGLPEFEELDIIDRHSQQRHSVVPDRGILDSHSVDSQACAKSTSSDGKSLQ